MFRNLSSEETGLDFSNTVAEDDSLNIIQYLYLYNGGGVAAGDVNNDGWPDLYFSANRLPNRLFINLGPGSDGKIRFKDSTEKSGINKNGNWSTGITMVDINGDGWLDIYQCYISGYKNLKGQNQLLINQGCTGENSIQDGICFPIFKDEAPQYGLDFSVYSNHAGFFDYDLDGDLDMYLLCQSMHSTESYRDTATTRIRHPLAGDRLLENRSGEISGTEKIFTEVSEAAGIKGGIAGYGLGLSIGDINQDQYPDIYIGNDFHENDFLYINQGDGTFRELGSSALGHTSYFSMGNDIADFNNDGWLDLISLDMKPEDEIIYKRSQGPDSWDIYEFKREFGYHHQFPQNCLQLNKGLNTRGEIRFSEVANQMGIAATDWSWSALFADLDLDGWKDLFISNGIPRRPNDLDYLKFISNRTIQENASDQELINQMPSGVAINYLYRNNAGTSFENKIREWGLDLPSVSNGLVLCDFDLDGDLDIAVNNLNAPAFYFENSAFQKKMGNYLTLVPKGPPLNSKGIGIKVTLYYEKVKQYQELQTARGWLSSQEPILFFGIEKSVETIDSLVILWPGGKKHKLSGLRVNQRVIINFEEAVIPSAKNTFSSSLPMFAPSGKIIHPFIHIENKFSDNNREPLIPYHLSRQGPKIAVGDVNGDLLEDFYIGGAAGQEGILFLQNNDGQFFRNPQKSFENDKNHEDTGVLLVDVDGDGDLDLYVGSGGNQFHREDSLLLDRLYINDGMGNFNRSTSSLPFFFNHTSCVAAQDIDQDGDTDLFIGSRSVAFSYGKIPDQYLLLNDGSGKFSHAPESLIDLKNLGMVTDAIWVNLDQNPSAELVIVGDWMPVTIFKQEENKFHRSVIPESTGWWNCINAIDADEDQDMDLILGNWGSNFNLITSPIYPVRLYLQDFDHNLTPDPVLTYVRQNREFPIMHLDPLAGQMVFLKKKYRTYESFAGQDISEVFESTQINNARIGEVVTFNHCFAINDGNAQLHLKNLPPASQISSIHAIEIISPGSPSSKKLIMAGNTYEVSPVLSRLDAGYGDLLFPNANGDWTIWENREINLWLEGPVRDLKMIQVLGKPYLLVAYNNLPMQMWSVNE